jgi:hypothetical protein
MNKEVDNTGIQLLESGYSGKAKDNRRLYAIIGAIVGLIIILAVFIGVFVLQHKMRKDDDD